MCSDLKNWPIFSSLEPEFVSGIHMVMVYGESGNKALIVTKDKKVYFLENNTASDAQKTFCPTKVEILCGKDVKTIACGSKHALALTENGEVYMLSQNQDYCTGYKYTNYYNYTPTVNMPLMGKLLKEHVVNIACGSAHSLFVTEGKVSAWGSINHPGWLSSSYQLNQDVTYQINSILAGKKTVDVACGQNFSMMITDKGEVYGWGTNDNGQLGIGHCTTHLIPCKVISLEGIVIVKVVCGCNHVLALTDDGKLYAWGANDYGQLGLGHRTRTSNPCLVTHEMGRVSDIAALHCSRISLAVGENGKVYMWGHCSNQALLSPTAVEQFSTVHDVLACYASPRIMHKPLILPTKTEREKTILQCLENAFNDESTSDLTIQVENQSIHVHKAILKIRSAYFKNMFQHNWSENNQSVIKHKDYSYIVFKTFLKYLYTGVVDVPQEKTLELFKLANAYCEDCLKRRCIQLIKRDISIENVVLLYITAIQYNAKELEKFCFDYALKHMPKVVRTKDFAKLDQKEMYIFIYKAAVAGAFKTISSEISIHRAHMYIHTYAQLLRYTTSTNSRIFNCGSRDDMRVGNYENPWRTMASIA